ncbi:hypothetical protein GCM10028777_40220 [Angustibacter speluncae]
MAAGVRREQVAAVQPGELRAPHPVVDRTAVQEDHRGAVARALDDGDLVVGEGQVPWLHDTQGVMLRPR